MRKHQLRKETKPLSKHITKFEFHRYEIQSVSISYFEEFLQFNKFYSKFSNEIIEESKAHKITGIGCMAKKITPGLYNIIPEIMKLHKVDKVYFVSSETAYKKNQHPFNKGEIIALGKFLANYKRLQTVFVRQKYPEFSLPFLQSLRRSLYRNITLSISPTFNSRVTVKILKLTLKNRAFRMIQLDSSFDLSGLLSVEIGKEDWKKIDALYLNIDCSCDWLLKKVRNIHFGFKFKGKSKIKEALGKQVLADMKSRRYRKGFVALPPKAYKIYSQVRWFKKISFNASIKQE